MATSHVAATTNRVFRIVNYGLHRPPELYIGDDPTVDWASISWVGPIRILFGGYCTALYTYGPHLFIFKRSGAVLALDEGEVLSPIITAPQQFVSDSFGFNTAQYLSFLAIPAKTRIIRFDPNTLEQVNMSPSSVQGFLSAEGGTALPGGIIAAAPTRLSNEIWAITQGHAGESIAISRGVAFKDGFFWTNQTVYSGGGAAVGGSIFEQSSQQNVFEFGIFQDDAFQTSEAAFAGEVLIVAARGAGQTAGEIYAHPLYGEGFARQPSLLAANSNYISSRVSPDGVAAGLSVLPTQVRIWGDKGDVSIMSVTIYSDEGSVQLVGLMGDKGPATFPVPEFLTPRIGRTFRIGIVGAGNLGSTTRIDFPIAIDYEFVPSTKDNFTLRLTATSEQMTNTGGEWIRDSGRAIVDRLLALEGSTTTIEFTDGTQWSVLVQKVASVIIKKEEPRTNSPTWLVTVDCRRL